MGKFKALKILAVVAGVILLAVILTPWKSTLENKLKAALESHGLQKVQLKVARVALKTIVLEDISVGEQTPLTLKNLSIGYSLADLWQGRLRELSISGISLEAKQGRGKWVVTGLEELFKDSSGKAGVSVPVTAIQLNGIKLDSAKLENSTLRVVAESWQLDSPFHISWKKSPEPAIAFGLAGANFKMDGFVASDFGVSVSAMLNESAKQWAGKWQIKDINIKSDSADIPTISGAGLLAVKAERILFSGQFKSSDNSYNAEFKVDYLLNDPEKSKLTITAATAPWSGGTISVKDVAVTLSGKQAIKVNLIVEHVSIDELMQLLTSKRASATGVVSGTLPITIAPDGTITVQEGKLQAEKPGTITMQPDAIPGDNAQVSLVRDVLKDLHYSLLSISADSGKDNKLSVLMTVEGNNPQVYKGKPVKLNVHLTGDVLDFIRQSVASFTNPKMLLKQDENEKK